MGNLLSNESPSIHLSDMEIARKLIAQQNRLSDRSSEGSSNSREEQSPSIHSKHLTSNLMRQQTRDPLFYYEIIQVLGVGSMGSVAMVRKREEAIGGSARRNILHTIRRKERHDECFRIPLFGDFFRCLMDHSDKLENESRHPRQALDIMNVQTSIGNDNAPGPIKLKESAATYALKSIHLNRVTDKVFIKELKNEIEILKNLDHPHIVRPMETFVHRNQLFIVMELCAGGDLYSRDPYTEEEAARIISCILSAVSYIHTKNIVHRDLKYENILFVSDSPRAEIKLIDFGLSKKYASDAEEMTEGVGTIYTMAPEVLKGTYTSKADLWSVGVIAYMLLSSQMPFYGRKRRHIIEQIMECKFDFKGRRWRRVSEQAKNFVTDLLVGEPDNRATADEAFQSFWLRKRKMASIRGPTEEEVEVAHDTLKNYARYSHLKKLALMVIAHKSTYKEIGILRKIFQDYDKMKDGVIRRIEFKEALATYGYQDDELNRLFDAMDLDGTGTIRYTEFLAATIEAHGEIDENRIADAFDRLDSDDSGFISVENLRELLGQDIPQERLNAIIREADLTEDMHISYPEFLALWEEEPKTNLSRSSSRSSFRPRDNTIKVPEKDVRIKTLMRQDSDAESRTLSRANFLEEKKMSERKAEEAHMIDLHQVTKVVLNELDEVVEDPEAESIEGDVVEIPGGEEMDSLTEFYSFDSTDLFKTNSSFEGELK